jgi:hypothetical protein
MVHHAEEWPWSSASPLAGGQDRPSLAPWPVAKPEDWIEWLNVPELPRELEEIRESIRKGWPFGNPTWRAGAMRRLDWEIRGPRGRPRGSSVSCRDLVRSLGRG